MSWENILKIKSPSHEIMDEVKREAEKFERSQQRLFDAGLFLSNAYPHIKKWGRIGPLLASTPFAGFGPIIKLQVSIAADIIFRVYHRRGTKRELERLGLTKEKVEEIKEWFGDE